MAEYDNVTDELEALISGENKLDEVTEEDTDLDTDGDTGSETNEQIDGDAEDTDDGEQDGLEENTLADDDDLDDNSEENDEDTEVELDGVASDGEDTDDESQSTDGLEENGTDTKDEADVADAGNTDEVDYQKEYQELLEKSKDAIEFRDKVAGVKFKANGKEVVGFSDPEKLIQAQQLAYNYSAKMAGFKPYREFMAPLKERGILEDPSKFDMAMKIMDGDTEALKQHMKNMELDPIDFDMDDVKYSPEVVRSSSDMLAIEDAMEQAKMHGVDDKVYDVVVKDWDDASFKEFVDDPAVQKDLIEHVENGSYDVVMQKVEQLSVLDPQFANGKMTDKYRYAVKQLNAEAGSVQESNAPIEADEVALAKQQLEADRIRLDNEAAELVKARAELESGRKNAEAEVARKKAASVSKSKPKKSNVKKAIDPMALDGKGIEAMLDAMMMGK